MMLALRLLHACDVMFRNNGDQRRLCEWGGMMKTKAGRTLELLWTVTKRPTCTHDHTCPTRACSMVTWPWAKSHSNHELPGETLLCMSLSFMHGSYLKQTLPVHILPWFCRLTAYLVTWPSDLELSVAMHAKNAFNITCLCSWSLSHLCYSCLAIALYSSSHGLVEILISVDNCDLNALIQ